MGILARYETTNHIYPFTYLGLFRPHSAWCNTSRYFSIFHMLSFVSTRNSSYARALHNQSPFAAALMPLSSGSSRGLRGSGSYDWLD